MKILLTFLVAILTFFTGVSIAWTYSDTPEYLSYELGRFNDGQFNFAYGLAIKSDGGFVVGDTWNGRVQLFDKDWNFSKSIDLNQYSPTNFLGSWGLTTDNEDSIYVAAPSLNKIIKLDSDGDFILDWGGLGSLDGQLNQPQYVDYHPYNGFLYVHEYGNQRISVFDRNGNFQFKFGSSGSGNGQFNQPSGMDVFSNGDILVVDRVNNRLQRINANGTYISKFGAGGSGDGLFNRPGYVYIDADENIYVSDSFNYRVQKFNSSYTFLTKVGARGDGPGQFATVGELLEDQDGNLVIMDPDNHRIIRFSKNLIYQSTIKNQFVGELNRPVTLEVDGDGNYYIGELAVTTSGLYKYDKDFNYIKQISTFGTGVGQIYRVGYNGLTIGPNGYLYVADYSNNKIAIFDLDGNFINEFGALGTGDGNFNRPTGIHISTDNVLYVADSSNHRIQRFTLSGGFIDKMGTNGTGNYQFRTPFDVNTDSNGNIYVVDVQNARIQKYDNNWVFISSWGTLGNGDDQFNFPRSIDIIDDNRIVYSDTVNYRVKSTDLNGNFIYKIGAGGQSYSSNGYLSIEGVVTKNVDGNIFLYAVDHFRHAVQINVYDMTPPVIVPLENKINTRKIKFQLTDKYTKITNVTAEISGDSYACIAVDGSLDELDEIIECDLIGIADGEYEISVSATDSKTNTTSLSHTFALDTYTKPVRITQLGLILPIPDKDKLYYNFTSSRPRIHGVAESNSNVFYVFGTKTYTTKADVNGLFMIYMNDPGVFSGLNNIKYYAVDEFGNKSIERTLTINLISIGEPEDEVLEPTPTLEPTITISPEITVIPSVSITKNITPTKSVSPTKVVEKVEEKQDILGTLWTSISKTLDTDNFAGYASAVGLIINGLMLGYMYPNWYKYIILMITVGKKQRRWGIVYDKTTGNPLSLAVISLYDNAGNFYKSSISDMNGRYLLVADRGQYKVKVQHDLYETSEFIYNVKDAESNMTQDIMLLKKEEMSLGNSVRDFLVDHKSVIVNSVFLIGFVLSLVSLIYLLDLLNILIFSIYFVQILMMIYNKYLKRWGVVVDNFGSPVQKAFVRVFDTSESRQVDVAITDTKGRYAFIVDPLNEYLLNVKRFSVFGADETNNSNEKYIRVKGREVIAERISI